MEWPDGAELSLANLRRAAGLGLHIEWLSFRIVDDRANIYRQLRNDALLEYERTVDEMTEKDLDLKANALTAYHLALADALWEVLNLEVQQ